MLHYFYVLYKSKYHAKMKIFQTISSLFYKKALILVFFPFMKAKKMDKTSESLFHPLFSHIK